MTGKVIMGWDVSDGWETIVTGVAEQGVLTIHDITRRYRGEAVDGNARTAFENPYLCQYPAPLKVGDGAIFRGRNVIIRAIEPGGERNRALVQDAETGRERNVDLDRLEAMR